MSWWVDELMSWCVNDEWWMMNDGWWAIDDVITVLMTVHINAQVRHEQSHAKLATRKRKKDQPQVGDLRKTKKFGPCVLAEEAADGWNVTFPPDLAFFYFHNSELM
jgi:hypothetical protein